MNIRLLNFTFEIEISNKRILEFLLSKLSRFTYWDCDTVLFISQVEANEINSPKCDLFGNSKVCFEKDTNTILFYYSDKDEHLYLEFVILQYIFLMLMDYGVFYIHGACLTINKDVNKGILLLGQSGSGKTSLALKMIGRGEYFVTDDFVLIKKRGDNYAAYMNRALPHIFRSNLCENFVEYQECIPMEQCPSEYKIDIQIEGKSGGVYMEYITPKYIFLLSDGYYPQCRIEKIDVNKIIAYIIKGAGNLFQYSYKKYYEFAINLCQQCYVFQLKKKIGIDHNVDEIYKLINAQCNK